MTKENKNPNPVVAVLWRDASYSFKSEIPKEDLGTQATFGVLVNSSNKDNGFLNIATEINYNKEKARLWPGTGTVIPLGSVEETKVVGFLNEENLTEGIKDKALSGWVSPYKNVSESIVGNVNKNIKELNINNNDKVSIEWIDAAVYYSDQDFKKIRPSQQKSKGIIVKDNENYIDIKNPETENFEPKRHRHLSEHDKPPTLLSVPKGMIKKIEVLKN